MNLATFWLLAAAIAVPSFAFCLPARANERRTPIVHSNVHLEGPAVVIVRELAEPSSAAASGAREQSLPRLRAPRVASSVPAPAANAIDTGAGFTAAPAQAFGFEGLSNSDNMSLTGLDLTPPDPQLAVGPDHIVEFINSIGRISDRSGNTIASFTLYEFFAVPPRYGAFDPKLIYDALSGRWFSSVAARQNNETGPDQGKLYLAVSQTSDPTGAWNVYSRSFTNIFPDQPGLGLTDDKVTVSSNMGGITGPEGTAAGECFTNGGYCGEQTVVFQKSDLLAGAPADQVGSFAFPMNLERFTVRPAHSLTSTSDQYLATFSLASRSKADIIRITGTPDEGNVTEADVTELTILTQLDPPPSITAGSGSCIVFDQDHGPPPCIDSGDFRLLEAVWRDNKLWLAAPGACRPSGDNATRSCAHLIEVETDGTPTKTQDMMYGAPGEYYSWPAIRTDAAGDLFVSLTHTNASIFAEARVAGRLAGDAPNSIGGSTLVKAGETVHTSGRWGDYLGAAVDPSHPSCVWVVGEYAKTTLGRDWSTYIASAAYGDGCAAGPAPTVTPVRTAAGSSTPHPSLTPTRTPTATRTPTPTFTLTPTPTITPTATPLPRYGDVNCDESVSSVDAALVLQYSAQLVSSLRCQQSADVNHDGAVNALDAVLILQLNAGLLSTLPSQ